MRLTDILSFRQLISMEFTACYQIAASLSAYLTASAASPCGEVWVMGVNEPD